MGGNIRSDELQTDLEADLVAIHHVDVELDASPSDVLFGLGVLGDEFLNEADASDASQVAGLSDLDVFLALLPQNIFGLLRLGAGASFASSSVGTFLVLLSLSFRLLRRLLGLDDSSIIRCILFFGVGWGLGRHLQN